LCKMPFWQTPLDKTPLCKTPFWQTPLDKTPA
jgi:hypothetical protein